MTLENINIRILTGLRPLNTNKLGGLFPLIRYNELINRGIPCEMYMITNTYSKGVKIFYQLLKGIPYTDNEHLSKSYPEFHDILLKSNILSQILFRIYLPFLSRHQLDITAIQTGRSMNITQNSILHVHWTFPHGYYGTVIAKKCGIPCVITAHGSDIHTNPRYNGVIKKYTIKTLESADKVIFVSNALLASAKELGYSGENAVVIPNGIDPTYFYPIEKETAMQKTGWCQSKKYVVGFVGNLIYVKRADKFVKIFSEIQKIIGDVEFVLVGDGDLREEIQNECNELGLMVTFAGRVPHEAVAAWMNLFDVMILPSRNEGWPCVVLEAYACGVPVVGSNNGGIAEALGGLGVVVEEGNGFVEGFAKGVCDVLMGVHPTDSSELVKHAAKYTWESLASMEIEVYTSLSDREISGDEN